MKSFVLAVLSVAATVGLARADSPPAVKLTIDASQNVRPISPYIYGVNQPLNGPYSQCTLTRVGGNRWTAYNWTNNASNAGNDWHFQNDGFLGGGDTPGGALIPFLKNAQEHHAGILLTIPINGYVAADKRGDGDVHHSGPDYLKTRFQVEGPRKGSPFTLTPDAAAPKVFQDEFVNWVESNFGSKRKDSESPIWFALDNEPDLWASTHAEVHPKPVTYSELVEKSIDYAASIKDVDAHALIFGPVNYGWEGYVNLQHAPDAAGRDFQAFYLHRMKEQETAGGRRLLDVLDVHWYPEAQGGGSRITGSESTPGVVAARVQAPRSLWDKSYSETSWITRSATKGPIALLPRLFDKIDKNYPGTKLAVTEYNYGGGAHISGAIAEADVLGIFGRDGVFAACEWPMAKDESYIAAAFQMFRDFDAKRGAFGNTSVAASSDRPADCTIYASIDSHDAHRMVFVAINKTDHLLQATIQIKNGREFRQARCFQLTDAAAKPVGEPPTVMKDPSTYSRTLPALSVSAIELIAP